MTKFLPLHVDRTTRILILLLMGALLFGFGTVTVIDGIPFGLFLMANGIIFIALATIMLKRDLKDEQDNKDASSHGGT